MSIVMCLHANGQTKSFILNHKEVNLYFQGEFTFCGSIPNLNAVAITRLTPKQDDIINTFSKAFPNDFDTTYGDILLIGSDENGEECDINVANILQYLK